MTIKPGDDFAEKIRIALKAFPRLWLLVTPESVESKWVTSEWGAAWVLQKEIVPILLRCSPDQLPEQLKNYQSIDYHNCRELIKDTFPISNEAKVGLEAVLEMADNFIKEEDNVRAALAIGRGLLMLKDYDNSFKVFEYISKEVPKSHRDYHIVLGNLAYSLIAKRKYQEAVKLLLQVKRIKNGRKFLISHKIALAYAYKELNQDRKYKEWLDKSKECPNFDELTEWFGQIFPKIKKDLKRY
jgi:tetratricopeptide (TPR) repeat protein